MFTLQIQSIDTPHPLFNITTTSSATNSASPSPKPNNSNIVELKGILHLFRNRSPSTTSLNNPFTRTTLLFVVAVPNYLSSDEFLLFCGSYLDHFSELLFIRPRSVIYFLFIWFSTLSQVILPVHHRPGFSELPTCPVCLERLDHDTSGIQSTLCDHSFHCPCISKWTYLSCRVCRLCQQHDEKPSCAVCGTLKNLWVCVICGFVGCGRYEEKHAIRHWEDTQHCYFLELETQQVWDYVGDNYVHRLNQSKADSKSVITNFHCMSLDGDYDPCGDGEDSGISGALFSSKVEAIVDEYNRLLATQLETQRQHYESLLVEAKGRRESAISYEVEKTLASRMQVVQYKLEKHIEEKKLVADTNQELMKNQKVLREKVKEIEEREISSLRSRDEKILDLEEQIRDLKVYVEAQKTLANMTDSDGIKGGTLLPVEHNQSSPANPKRRTKSHRRRT
ncbi:hypothetical protein F0562_030130 [Nyssa sinensis]|uniref:UBP-type domain-containing protein n=1 Tax=Nyssa sinensis TaxID=561372 RepID=A0A5J5B043_9ASTE|nr:hypothetical protein F0562_030130 [Nyssa sinensis]